MFAELSQKWCQFFFHLHRQTIEQIFWHTILVDYGMLVVGDQFVDCVFIVRVTNIVVSIFWQVVIDD